MAFLRLLENRLALLCVCLVLPVALLLTVAQGAHDWYTAPVLPYMAVLIALFIRWTMVRWSPAKWIWIGLALFTGGRHLHYLATPRRQLQGLFQSKDLLRRDDTLLLTSPSRQHLYLYLLWHSQPTAIVSPVALEKHSGKLVLLDKNVVVPEQGLKADILWQSDEYLLKQAAGARPK